MVWGLSRANWFCRGLLQLSSVGLLDFYRVWVVISPFSVEDGRTTASDAAGWMRRHTLPIGEAIPDGTYIFNHDCGNVIQAV